MSACVCDYEPAEFVREQDRTARKLYRCSECMGVILPGERYTYMTSLYAGEFATHRTCCRCQGLRRYVESNIPCFCFLYGAIEEAALETLKEFAHELPGLLFGGLRRVVAIRRHRAQHRGLLA